MKSVLFHVLSILMIYVGTVLYVLASYFHLKMEDKWLFWKAYFMAIPVIMIEYFFSLHGNHYLYFFFDYSPVDILIVTICFYFVNIWLLNYFVLKHPVSNIYKEFFCFGLILTAFVFTTVIK